MSKEFTQSECRAMFIEALQQLCREIKSIDDKTPWSEREPKWWLDMMDIDRKATEIIGGAT